MARYLYSHSTPGTTIKVFCATRNLRYTFSEEKEKTLRHNCEDDRLVGCFCTRNSLKTKSKANNETHVLKLYFRFQREDGKYRATQRVPRERDITG